MQRTLLVSAAIAGLLGTTVVAQGMGHGPMDAPLADFATLDADGDGQVTAAEIAAAARARFAVADADGNGGLDAAELVAQAEARRMERLNARMQAMLAERDANGDGLIQPEEMVARATMAERMFDRLDADGSGGISAEEFAAMQARMQARMQERMGRGDEDGWGGGDRREGHGHDGEGWAPWQRQGD